MSISLILQALLSKRSDAAFVAGLQEIGPVGEAVQRRLMGTFQLDGGYRHVAGKNSGIIAIRVRKAGDWLLAEPVIDSTTRVRAFLEDRTGQFAGLAREAHTPLPVKGHIYVKQYLGGQPLAQDKFGKPAGEPRGMLIDESISAVRQRDGECRNVIDNGLSGCADGAGIEHVLT